MGATYTRQSTYAEGDVIQASDTNDEFDQLLAAFAASTGHTHDGTTGEGGPISTMAGHSLTFGAGTTGTDITLTFDGESNDGVIKWMEDEDYFEFSDDILVASTEKLQFRDTAIYINSSTDGQLDLVADTEIQIAATTVDINGAVDISGNLSVGGNLDVTGTFDLSDSNFTNAGDIQLDSISGDADTNTSITFSGSDVITVATGGSTAATFNADQTTTFSGAVSGTSADFDGGVTVDNITIDGTEIDLSSGDLTVDVAGDIILDADGGDVLLKDAGTQYAALTNTSGNLIIKSGSTTAMTFSGANVTFAGTVTIGSAAISEAELEILDGATVTTNELNIIDGNTSATSTTVADADRVVLNDNGTMVQVAVTDLAAYFDDEITAMPNLVTTAATTVGALNSGSITSGFGTIDTGSSTITTTGLISGGSLDIDDVVINGSTIGHTDDTDLITVANGIATVAGELSVTTLDIGGTNITADAGELNTLDGITAVVGELNALDLGSTAVGTAIASKAVVLDSNKDYTGIRNLTLTGNLTIPNDGLFAATNTAGNILVADGTNFNSIAVGDLSEISTAADNDVLLAVDTSGGGLKKITRSTIIAGTGSSGDLANVVEDSTPQLGGSLDVNGNDIVSVSNGNITITPNGSGVLRIDGSNGIDMQSGAISIKNSGAESYIRFYCESSNAHYTQLQAAPHSAYSGNVTVVLPASADTLVGKATTDTLTNKTFGDNVSFGDNNITNVGDIALDSISADATDINVAVTDNSATAFTIKQGSDAYFVVDTGNSSESVSIGTGVSGTAITLGHSTSEVTVADNLTVTGDLTVSGTTTTVNSTTVNLNDHNIVLDSGNSTSAVINGAGITIEGGSGDDATFTYNTTGPKFELKLGSSHEDLQVDQLIAASLDISGNVDVDGTLEADAITVDGTTLAEFISDTTGAMFSSNTETGITVTYQDGDNTIDLAVDAAQTGITSVKNTSLVIGRDDDNLIKFGTDNQIIFEVSGGDNVIFKASGEIEAASLDISGDVDVDGTLEADVITVNGTALNTVIAGVTVTNATNAAHVLVTDNESTNENNLITFVENATSSTGNVGLEMDGNLTYNPSTGRLTATQLSGTLQTAAQTNITSVGALDGGSITSNFGTIDTGSSAITTTGLISGGSLDIDNVLINGSTIGHTDDTDLITVANGLVTVAGEVSLTTLDIGGTNVTATAAELNILDGVTSTAAELNVLDGITAVVGELNALDIGSTAVGTAVASKAVILDSNKDYTGIRNFTTTGLIKPVTYQETYVSKSAASTVTCDLATANHFAVTLDQNTTFAFTNPPSSGTSFSFTLIVTQHSTAVTLTWPNSVDWAGGSAPDAAGNNEVQAYGFITRDGGTTYYGFLGGTAIG